MEFDPGMFFSVIGGAVTAWTAIRADIVSLRRDVDRLMKKVFN